MKRIYLDYNATTSVAPSVLEAMNPYFSQHYGNPSSTHALGRAAREAVEDARMYVGGLLGTDRSEVVFTSGGTESNNMALLGIMLAEGPAAGGHLITTTIEHPAILEPAHYLERLGFDVTYVEPDSTGVVQPESIEASIRTDTRLVSVMHANNEIGVVQPIRQISEICQRHSILMHTDAAQSAGKIPTKVDELGVDLLTLAGHKFYAPKGVGALYVREGVHLERVHHGANQESSLRPGTENVPFIVALGEASRLAARFDDTARDRLSSLRDRLADQLCQAVDSLRINGAQAPRLPNTLSVCFPGVHAAELLSRVPEICASTGAACHSESDAYSPTLKAIGLSAVQASGTVRMSVGWYTSEEEIDRAASLLIDAWENSL